LGAERHAKTGAEQWAWSIGSCPSRPRSPLKDRTSVSLSKTLRMRRHCGWSWHVYSIWLAPDFDWRSCLVKMVASMRFVFRLPTPPEGTME